MSRIEEVQKLIDTFKMERIIYVILTSISAITLIGLGMYMAIAEHNIEGFIALLMPSGTLTLCIFRVLKMWDDALKFISNSNDNDHE